MSKASGHRWKTIRLIASVMLSPLVMFALLYLLLAAALSKTR